MHGCVRKLITHTPQPCEGVRVSKFDMQGVEISYSFQMLVEILFWKDYKLHMDSKLDFDFISLSPSIKTKNKQACTRKTVTKQPTACLTCNWQTFDKNTKNASCHISRVNDTYLLSIAFTILAGYVVFLSVSKSPHN
jgi:hypothetical protein